MRLADLDPRFYGAGGAGIRAKDGAPVPQRSGVGMTFDCPCGCGTRRAVAFANPMDGGPPVGNPGEPTWQRTGDGFETLALRPSLRVITGCKWHGFITNGEAVAV